MAWKLFYQYFRLQKNKALLLKARLVRLHKEITRDFRFRHRWHNWCPCLPPEHSSQTELGPLWERQSWIIIFSFKAKNLCLGKIIEIRQRTRRSTPWIRGAEENETRDVLNSEVEKKVVRPRAERNPWQWPSPDLPLGCGNKGGKWGLTGGYHPRGGSQWGTSG